MTCIQIEITLLFLLCRYIIHLKLQRPSCLVPQELIRNVVIMHVQVENNILVDETNLKLVAFIEHLPRAPRPYFIVWVRSQ